MVNNDLLLEVDKINKEYSDRFGIVKPVIRDISFSLNLGKGGSITSIIAPYGGGLTTLLKIISGIEKPTSGKVNGGGVYPFIPESASSFPWLTVKENIEQVHKYNKGGVTVEEAIELTGLTGYEDHIPDKGSCGFRFRISVAAALATGKKLIIIDDSLKRAGGVTKEEIFYMLLKIKEKNYSFIYGTTNITDALLICDRVIALGKKPGEVIKDIEIDRHEMGIGAEISGDKLISLRNEIEALYRDEQIKNHVNLTI